MKIRQKTMVVHGLIAVVMILFLERPMAAEERRPLKIAIIKADDVRKPTANWDRFITVSRERGVKISGGIICNSLKNAGKANYASWLKEHQATGWVEWWNHGWDHKRLASDGKRKKSEFNGSGYDHQKRHFEDAQSIMTKVLGTPPSTFGTPYNAVDVDTVRVVNENKHLRFFFCYKTPKGLKTVLPLHMRLRGEHDGTGKPNFKKFKDAYGKAGDVTTTAIQFHPNNFGDSHFTEYTKILDFLIADGWTFVLPSDYVKLKVTATATPPKETNKMNDNGAFESLLEAEWKEVFADSCTTDWKRKWFLDGETATITHSKKGMDYWAGPKEFHDPDHAVLWTKQDFEGDLKIEYEYTRLDKAVKMVTIIYIQATGSGKPGYAVDISKWADKRSVPTMSTYFKNMNTYHVSYAAFSTKGKDPDKDYIRARRYMCRGLKGTEMKNEYLETGLFKTGVPHKITIIKRDKEVFMLIKNSEQEQLCHFVNHKFPAIKEGKIGLRHMYTRGARYTNFKVSQLQKKMGQ